MSDEDFNSEHDDAHYEGEKDDLILDDEDSFSRKDENSEKEDSLSGKNKGSFSGKDEDSFSGKDKDSLSGKDEDSLSGKDKDSVSGKEEDTEDKRRNEVRKEFTKEFVKKLAKYIPSKINFKGNISKRKLIKEIDFNDKFVSNLTLFKNYILITVDSALHFYTRDLILIFKNKFVEGKEEILSLNPINDETIIFGTYKRLLVLNFYEKKEKQITFEIIQEIKDTVFYCLNEKLYKGDILIGGMDRKYAFYEIINKNEKISKNNKIQCMYKIDKVHNVYDDDCPDVVDLNNGRIFSWLNDDKNIKVIEYGHNPRIIKSMNGYGLHNAGLVSDRYLILMGLTYPKYYTWVMDTETLEIVHKWKTQYNDSFLCSLSENKFLYCDDEKRFALDEFSEKDGKFERKTIYKSWYKENHSKEDWKETYAINNFLNENTFATINMAGRLMLFQCEQE